MLAKLVPEAKYSEWGRFHFFFVRLRITLFGCETFEAPLLPPPA
jgi:hypothetical protein